MCREARARGANAFAGMRFDCNQASDIMSEVAAHRTAVTAEPGKANISKARLLTRPCAMTSAVVARLSSRALLGGMSVGQ